MAHSFLLNLDLELQNVDFGNLFLIEIKNIFVGQLCYIESNHLCVQKFESLESSNVTELLNRNIKHVKYVLTHYQKAEDLIDGVLQER